MNEKIEILKELWDNYNETWSGEQEYDKFIEIYPKEKVLELKLEEYTNIKHDDSIQYFTNYIERKTEKCGKFRTASSFAYGIYKVKKDKKPKEELDFINANFLNVAIYRSLKNKSEKDFKNKYIGQKDAETYFKDEVLPKLSDLSKYVDMDDVKPLDINYARKVAYMYNIDKLIPIFKKEVLESIAKFFDITDDIDFSSYKATEPILDKIIEVFEITTPIDIEMSQKIASFLWKNFGKSVSFDSKNIIYYGAPGTGKTYTVQNAVKQKILLENAEALFTQFHPSFGYEDFIEGLKPYINNGATELKLTNGIFKKFCKKAMDNLIESRKNGTEPKEYYFVADEINRAELSTVFGELLLCLEESKRVDFEKKDDELVLKEDSMLIETQYSYLIDQDEDAVYIDNGEYKFGVPINLYFIGTMNDIDRSIDSFDLALRRRFIWERMDCDYSIIANDVKFANIDQEMLESYIEICKKLNSYIAKDLGLGKSYELGHSYFMDITIPTKGQNEAKITQNNIQNLFDKKLKPLIEEYLRGEYNQVEIEEKIKIAKKIFEL